MKPNQPLRISTIQKEPLYQAGKWFKIPVLLDGQEMRGLFEALSPLSLFQTALPTLKGEGKVDLEEFLNCYDTYANALKEGRLPEEEKFRPFFSSIITRFEDHLYVVELPEEKQIVKVSRPVIQLQHHRAAYSKEDGQFRSMVYGNSFFWGILFSYPQLYENPVTHALESPLTLPETYPNTLLFRSLQKWIREHTIPTPFVVKGKIHNVPIRIGKMCLNWIHLHPQLQEKELYVATKPSEP